MNSSPPANEEHRIHAERRLLAALCQQTLDDRARKEVLRRLSNHKFLDADSEIALHLLSQLPDGTAIPVRELLATRVTLLGFPDFELAPFFEATPPAESEIPALLQLL